MKTRVLSGLIMVPFMAVVYFGGLPLFIACFLVGMVGIWEFIRGFRSLGYQGCLPLAWAMTALLYLLNLSIFRGVGSFSIYIPVLSGEGKALTLYMCWFLLTVLLSFLYLFRIDERKLEDGLITAISIFYVAFFSYHVLLISQVEMSVTWPYISYTKPLFLWLVFLSAFGTDVMAYFSGYFFGKHKLCPKISPKKTVEGAVGGALGSLLLCGIFGWFFLRPFFPHCLIIGLAGGVLAQFGDLTASIFKRKMGIKDYGNLIPGHGGIMDRFDSVLFTAPLVYYYIMIVLQ